MEHDHPFELMANEALLPCQFYPETPASKTPIGRLMMAVLETAIHDYQGRANATGRATTRNWYEASAWLFGGLGAPFSFDFVCEVLGIEPDYLRKGLRRWDGQLARRSGVQTKVKPIATRVRVRK